MGYRKFLFLLFTVFASAGLHAQDREDVLKQADGYQWPSDRAVLEKLDRWQDLKFGVLMHWGIYSVPGIIESWSICNEDWIKRPEGSVYEDYKRWYWGLSDELNPVKFNPEQWAEVFSRAGILRLRHCARTFQGQSQEGCGKICL